MVLDKGLAVATVSKHCKRAKTLLAEAVRDRLLVDSPFENLKGGSEANPDRQRFIDSTMAQQILEACPDADWRCIFALARFCGMRCPSEVLTLKWTDIDWAAGRIRIDSPKTGLRFCPLFPEVRTELAAAFELAPDGAVHIVRRYRNGQNLRTQFLRILERAGIVPWAKPFVNLRSSCRTELENEGIRSHVCDSWLGHSTAVAQKHYLQVTDADWKNALQRRPLTGSLVTSGAATITKNHATHKPLENIASDASQGFVMARGIPPTGLEPVTKL
ncbi:MAG: tyrosine-type recombinase/integrase [Pirellulaceae bacterium]|nr:tyrosine-type recombinase/integrase [Pirellulaceae bacterium]